MYDATTGQRRGNVDVITKAGTNDFHASMFEFLRNEDLNANDWFSKRSGQPRGILRQNQYGLTAAVHWSGTSFCSLVPGRVQSSTTKPTRRTINWTIFLATKTDAGWIGRGFRWTVSYWARGPAWSTPMLKYRSSALALLQLKLPTVNTWCRHTSINSSGVNTANYGAIDSEALHLFTARLLQ